MEGLLSALALTPRTTLLQKSPTSAGVANVGIVDALKNKRFIALYFSAHWCKPCRGFTPLLEQFYRDVKTRYPDGLEIVFVSSDSNDRGFADYYRSMPWLAIPYDARDAASHLSAKYNVNSIPTLILLDSHGMEISRDGRGLVSRGPDALPWGVSEPVHHPASDTHRANLYDDVPEA